MRKGAGQAAYSRRSSASSLAEVRARREGNRFIREARLWNVLDYAACFSHNSVWG